MVAVPEAFTFDGALPDGLTAELDDPVGLFVPGDAGAMPPDPAGRVVLVLGAGVWASAEPARSAAARARGSWKRT